MSQIMCRWTLSILKKNVIHLQDIFSIGNWCPNDWLNAGALGCYIFAIGDGTGLNWQQSKDYCESIGGFLTDILNQETQDFLVNSGFYDTEVDGRLVRWWIGGNDIENVSNINGTDLFIFWGHEVVFKVV